jgi:beta-phosphoglucomutase
MDGVLVNTGELHFQAWRRLAESRGQELSREQFTPTFGMTNPDAIRQLFGESRPEETRKLALFKEEAFRSLLVGRVTALPGAAELVRALDAAGHPQAVASSAPRENIDFILEALGLAACFDAVASADDVRRGKPNPEIFTLAARRLGVPPLDCVVLEDAVVGVRAAIRAGMRVYAVTTTRARDELAHADRVVDSLEELDSSDFVVP